MQAARGTDPGSDDCSKPFVHYRMCVDRHSFHEWGPKVFQYLENDTPFHTVHAKPLTDPLTSMG